MIADWQRASWRTAWMAALEQRASFALQLTFMVINDLTWLLFWVVVFSKTPEINGWRVNDVLVLFAIDSAGIGLALGAFAGVRDTGRVVATGELEALLTHPRPVLWRLMLRRVDPPILGDLVFGPVLFAFTGHGDSLKAWLLFGALALVVASMFLSFVVAAQASVFWLRGRNEFADLAFTAVTVFSLYPASVFGGAVRILLYTVIPTALMTTLPARILLDFSWQQVGVFLLAAVVMAAAALSLHAAGMRRYLNGQVA